MTTIITHKNKDNKTTNRCDARCYNAKGKKCKCICAGHNHGKGINEAILFASSHEELLKELYESDEILIHQGQLQIF